MLSILLALTGWAAAAPASPSKDPAGWAARQIRGLDEDSSEELFKLHRKYAALVKAKTAAGWQAGVYGAPVAQDPKPRPPARQIAESLARAQAALKELQPRLKSNPDKETRKAGRRLRAEIARLKRLDRLDKGTGADWADAVWHELSRAKPAHWTVQEATRPKGLRHSAAALCQSEGERPLCLVFDPWRTAAPDVFLLDRWEEKPAEGPLPAELFAPEGD